MLQKSSDLKGYSLRARDGDIGEIVDFLFSDKDWTVRYLVAKTGEWLESREVLLSPIVVQTPNDPARVVRIVLSREQIEKSPRFDNKKPVSRHYEVKYHQHHGWPYYWAGEGLWGAGGYPTGLLRSVEAWKAEEEVEPENPHLRSMNEVIGYYPETRDGEIGHIEDFIIDDKTWSVLYMEIDTRNWWPGGKKVLLARQWVEDVSWEKKTVKTDVGRNSIQEAPEYDEHSPITEQYELALFKHYGRELGRTNP